MGLPTDRPRPQRQSFRGWVQRRKLSPRLYRSLEGLTGKEEVTLFMTFLTAFKVLLYRYTGEPDILVGSGVANRRFRETEQMLGMVLNTVVFRTDLSGNPSFVGALARVKEVTLEAYAHQDLPFEKIVEALHPERNLSHNPIFQVLFAFHNTPMPSWEIGLWRRNAPGSRRCSALKGWAK